MAGLPRAGFQLGKAFFAEEQAVHVTHGVNNNTLPRLIPFSGGMGILYISRHLPLFSSFCPSHLYIMDQEHCDCHQTSGVQCPFS